VIRDDREIVAAIRARLADRVGRERYDVWFGPATQIVLRGETLEISVRDQFFQDWLRANFRKDLEAVVEEVCGRPLALEFRIAPQAAPRPPAASGPVPSQPAANPGSANGSTRATSNGAPSGRDLPPRRPLASLGSFVVGNSNCVAHTTAQLAAEQPGVYSPLFIHGSIGTGKTHLLEGICAAFRRARPQASTVYLSAEQFTSSFLAALHGTGLPSFRRKYRHLELLVIDDVQFFAGKRATLIEVLHTVDSLLRGGRQLVFAADRPPTALKMLGPELLARLTGGIVCHLAPAEYATRLGIVRHVAARLGMRVPSDVEAFIAANFTTQSRELDGALKQLQLAGQAHQRPINLALAEATLAELINHEGRAVKLSDIERAVCDVFALEPASLQSGGKARAVSHPRMLAMFLARKHTRAPLAQIGSYFGRRSHSTVISAQKKIESWMAVGATLQVDRRPTSLEETIRRIEERLRAG
jgi:chromosomal replication initiator protein